MFTLSNASVPDTYIICCNKLPKNTGIYVKPQHKTLIKQNFTKLLISKIVQSTTVSFYYFYLIQYNTLQRFIIYINPTFSQE